MSGQLDILDTMPGPAVFYGQYWARRPFVVRSAVLPAIMDSLITADELAGLACDDTARSRLVSRNPQEDTWTVDHGPLQEQDFALLPPSHWSLLVQQVEQFHPETALLLQAFGFSPRWLLDDIMVSFATPGGTVGPHADSYHVFLVQGQGNRRWRIAGEPLSIQDETNTEGIDLKILAHPFVGDAVNVTCGDVIYLPPRFAHEGIATEPSLTYSVGFLGPELSDLFMGYGQYLRDQQGMDEPYPATGLHIGDRGFHMAASTVDGLKSHMQTALSSDLFVQWLCEYFSGTGNDELSGLAERHDPLSSGELKCRLSSRARLQKPPHVKLAIAKRSQGGLVLGLAGETRFIPDSLVSLVDRISSEEPFILADIEGGGAGLDLVKELYNGQILEFAPD